MKTKIRMLFFFLFMLVSLTMQAQNTYYVNNAYTPGVDIYCTAAGNDATNVANNPNKPSATLSDAIAAAANGDTIYVDAGTYAENNVGGENGINKSVTIIGAGTGKTIFRGATTNSGGGNTFAVLAANNITIKALFFKWYAPTAAGGRIFDIDGRTGIVLENLSFQENRGSGNDGSPNIRIVNYSSVTIKGISYSQTQNGAYALILNEIDGDRKLPIVIGAFEAQSIAIALEKEIKPPRPLTHDLFKSFADRFDIVVKQVIIHKLVDGVFYSSMICERDKIEEIIDARTSDAIALALRFEAPIFTYKNILDKAGIYLNPTNLDENTDASDDGVLSNPETFGQEEKEESRGYKTNSLSELHQMLETAVQDEDYEKAAHLRDEISKRES